MAKIVYKSYNPNDNLLLPPCLGDYLPENHKARVVSAIIDRLDISEIEKGYKGGRHKQLQSPHASEGDSIRISEQCVFRPSDGEAAG